MSTCVVLCQLKWGIIAESGYIVDPTTQNIRRGPDYKSVKLAGSNSSSRLDTGPNPRQPLPGRTEGVDEEWFRKWLADHSDLQYIKMGLISIEKPADVKSASADMAQIKTGLEPLATPKDDRVKGADLASIKAYNTNT